MTIRILALCSLLCLAAPAGITAQSVPDDNTVPAAPTSPSKPALGNSTIGADDTVTIEALDADEISKTWRVGSTGDLDLPMIGKVHAAGLTSEQLEKTLEEGLKRYIRNPQVTVYVSDFRSQPITIAGAVHRPGTYQIEGSKTLLSAVMVAGGPDASGPTLILTRPVLSGPIPIPGAHLDPGGEHSSVELRLKDVLDPSTPESNLAMKPSDVVSVAMKPRMVYIIGEVSHPGAVELVTLDSVSVMQVLAAAGGLTKVAAANRSGIMRVDSQGLYKKLASINLKRVMTGKEEDRLLKPGDIVVVPSSSLKEYGQIAAVGAVGTALYTITRF
jgi:polysaccharide export outer membrane protein